MNNFLKIVVIFLINAICMTIMVSVFALVLKFCFMEIGKTINTNHHEEVQVIQKATNKFFNTKFNELKKYAEEQ